MQQPWILSYKDVYYTAVLLAKGLLLKRQRECARRQGHTSSPSASDISTTSTISRAGLAVVPTIYLLLASRPKIESGCTIALDWGHQGHQVSLAGWQKSFCRSRNSFRMKNLCFPPIPSDLAQERNGISIWREKMWSLISPSTVTEPNQEDQAMDHLIHLRILGPGASWLLATNSNQAICNDC